MILKRQFHLMGEHHVKTALGRLLLVPQSGSAQQILHPPGTYGTLFAAFGLCAVRLPQGMAGLGG